MKKKKLGEVLREKGKITAMDLEAAVAEQQGKVIHLGELMLERGLVSRGDLAGALEEVCRVPYMDCAAVVPDPKALKFVPRAMAERLSVLPIAIDRGKLIVAMAAPQNLVALDELRFNTGCEISPRLSFKSDLQSAIARSYGSGVRAETKKVELPNPTENIQLEKMEFISTSSRHANKEAIQEMQADLSHRWTPAVRLVSEVLQIAMARHASDIHIEPGANETAVRMRVDGVLRDQQKISRTIQNSLVSRIKILADMDISERRAPQDGRFMVAVGDRQLDLRVSTLPTQYGEKVVMRLLETSAPLSSYADMGMPESISASLWNLLIQPQGLVLVTGPTGSGKSSTLYSSLHKLRKPAVNIVTVEDPVEYVLPGTNQVHVNVKAGLTFASCLRSILRQDPNIIMVGEIRDQETAEIAMRAAQTGHMVLSTLHTNDSISAIVRLLDFGIPGYMISSSLSGVLGQRLVRKLCSCHKVTKATPEFRARLTQLGVSQPPMTMAIPAGCEKCDHTGYAGRTGIYELLTVDDAVRSIIRSSGRVDQIRDAAHAIGMRPMREDAIQKVVSGVTTLEEISRVVPMETVKAAACENCEARLLPSYQFCPTCGTRTPFHKSSRAGHKANWISEEVQHR